MSLIFNLLISLSTIPECFGCGGVGGPRTALPGAFPSREPAAVSHRGAHLLAPENTRAAAKASVALGVEYVEVDVRTSADGVLYILHDAEVDRTSDGRGRLDRLSSARIDRLDAGRWFAPRFAGEPIPRLEDYLRWIKGRARVYLDVKDAELAPLIEVVQRTGMAEEVFFGFGFGFGTGGRMMRFRRLAPDLKLKANAFCLAQAARAVERYGADIVETNLNWITPELVAYCRERGVLLMLSAFKENEDSFRRMLRWGPDLVNIEDTETFVRVRREMRDEPQWAHHAYRVALVNDEQPTGGTRR